MEKKQSPFSIVAHIFKNLGGHDTGTVASSQVKPGLKKQTKPKEYYTICSGKQGYFESHKANSALKWHQCYSDTKTTRKKRMENETHHRTI